MIARDELQVDDDSAQAQLEQAVEDDPLSFVAADLLESILAAKSDRDALVAFYYRRLEHVRENEGRAGERLRLWDRLAQGGGQLDPKGEGVRAYEGALWLAARELERRQN